MKRVLAIMLALLVVAIVAAAVAPFLIPADTYKRAVIEHVRAATGRELTLSGPVHVSLFPELGVKLEQAALSNASGASDPHMAEIERLTAAVELLPLLHGEVQVKRFILERPVLHLEVNAEGEPNWQFAPAAKAPAAAGGASNRGAVHGLMLGAVEIKNGSLTYRDARSGKAYNASDVEVETSLKSLNAPLSVKGSLNWNGQRVVFSMSAQSPKALMGEGETPLKASLESGDLLRFSFDGNASRSGAAGTVDFSAASLSRLSAWAAGSPPASAGHAALAFSAKGPLSCAASHCGIKGGQFTLDANSLNGDAAVNWGNGVPLVEARLSGGAIDVSSYLAEDDSAHGINDAEAAEPNEARIDLSGLRAVNANVSLAAESFQVKQLKLAKVNAALHLSGGVAALEVQPFGLYGGTAKLSAALDSANAVNITAAGSNIQAEKLLKELWGFDRLSGTMALDAHVAGRGASVTQLEASLSGGGHVSVKNGAIRGVNLSQLASAATALTTGAGAADQKTEFAELSGSFTLADGIVHNNDLLIMAALLRATGAGTVDVPREQVHYVLKLALASSGKAQGLGVPVKVEGSFAHLTFMPDIAGVVQDALTNPDKAKATLQTLKDQVKSNKGGLKQQLQDIKQNPDQLKGLLQGLR